MRGMRKVRAGPVTEPGEEGMWRKGIELVHAGARQDQKQSRDSRASTTGNHPARSCHACNAALAPHRSLLRLRDSMRTRGRFTLNHNLVES